MATILTERRSGGTNKGGVQVSVLGRFEVVARGRPLQFPSIASRLIAYLAVHRRRVTRVSLSGVLWPDSTQARAQASLRSTLWRVRSVHGEIVRADKEHLVLADDVVVDTDSLAKAAIGADDDPFGSPEESIHWFSCELLPDWYDDWVLFERERFRLMALHTLEQRSAAYAHIGDHACAVECALAAVHLAPLRESAHRALVQAHISNGNIAEAIRQYQRYRQFLLSELGVEPTEQMRSLFSGVGALPNTNVA